MLYNIKLDVTSHQRNVLKSGLDGSPNVPGSTDLFRVVLQDLTETQKLTILRQLTEEDPVPVLMLPDELPIADEKVSVNVSELAKYWQPNHYLYIDVNRWFRSAVERNYLLTIVDSSSKIYNLENVKREDELIEFLLPKFEGAVHTAILSKGTLGGPVGTEIVTDQPKGLNGPAA